MTCEFTECTAHGSFAAFSVFERSPPLEFAGPEVRRVVVDQPSLRSIKCSRGRCVLAAPGTHRIGPARRPDRQRVPYIASAQIRLHRRRQNKIYADSTGLASARARVYTDAARREYWCTHGQGPSPCGGSNATSARSKCSKSPTSHKTKLWGGSSCGLRFYKAPSHNTGHGTGAHWQTESKKKENREPYGKPKAQTNPRRPLFTLRPLPCERAPPPS